VTPLVLPGFWFINKCERGELLRGCLLRGDCSDEHECHEGSGGRGLHINKPKKKEIQTSNRRTETVPNAVPLPVALLTADSIRWQR